MPVVILSKSAEAEFARLPKKTQKKILKKLRLLQDNPFAGKLLGGKLRGLLSLHAWPYRIIYEFDKSKKIIVYKIVHRQKAYK